MSRRERGGDGSGGERGRDGSGGERPGVVAAGGTRECAAAREALTAGDYGRVRRLARPLAADASAPPAVRDEARALLKAVGMDPVPLLVALAIGVVVALLFLLFVRPA